jgi:tetratricopeptide (TPR) repeat protein
MFKSRLAKFLYASALLFVALSGLLVRVSVWSNNRAIRASFAEGVAAFGNKDHDRALALFSEVIRLDPKDDGAFYNRGCVYAALQQHDKAIADYSEAIRLNPKRAGAFNNRGISHTALGQRQLAVEDFKKADELKAVAGS